MTGKFTGRLKGVRLALAGGLAVVLVASILTVGSETAAFASSPSVSEAATFPVDNEVAGLSSLTINPQHVGDIVILLTQIHSPSITVFGVSSPKTGTWHLADRYVDTTNGVITEEVWWAIATSTGSTTVTATYSADVSTFYPELVADSFTTSSGATWSALVGSNVGAAGTSTTTITFPSLTSNADPNQLYWGYAEDTKSINPPSPTSGFTYSLTSFEQNLLVSDLALSPSISNTPPPAGTVSDIGNYTSIGVIFDATPTVTFNGNGGTGSMSPEAATTATALTTNTFTKAGYTFAGWDTSAAGATVVYTNGVNYPFTSGATLYAVWNAIPNSTVTFNANGGAGSMSTESHNVATALTTNTFTKAGYTFAGWDTSVAGTTVVYTNGASYPFTSGATLYAVWNAIPNSTVTFNANGGAGSMSTESHNVATALTTNTFTKAGYTFAGWDTSVAGTTVVYTDGASYPFTSGATLYAVWTVPVTTTTPTPTPTTYTVTFNGNGSTGGSMATETNSAATALTSNAFTRTGYTFAGWDTSVAGTTVVYTNGASYPFTASTTLYAQWTAVTTYTVTFNGNGSTGGSMATETNSEATALTSNAFTRTGYTFSRWNTLANGTGTSYAYGASYPFTASTTLYAQWTAVAPHASSIGGSAVDGGSRVLAIIGTGFVGKIRVITNGLGATVHVLHASATRILLWVHVNKTSRPGRHTFTIITVSGQKCTISYLTK
jgi:uncharacterized repeat protein (TIGR02543 family)